MRGNKRRSLCLAAISLLIASGSAWSASPGETHTVGGTISGLTGKGLVLRLNSQSTRSIGRCHGRVQQQCEQCWCEAEPGS